MATGTRKPDTQEFPEATTVRTDFCLSLSVFAKMTGVSAATLAKWEAGAIRLDEKALAHIGRVAGILKGLARVMRRSFLPTWIEQANNACAELGVRTPLDLFARGDYKAIEDMIFYMESGTPD